MKQCKGCSRYKLLENFPSRTIQGKVFYQRNCWECEYRWKRCEKRRKGGNYESPPVEISDEVSIEPTVPLALEVIPWSKTAKGKEYQRKYRRQYRQKKKGTVGYKLRANISRTISRSLRQRGATKEGSSFLQCVSWSVQELKAHLESGWEPWMTWDNYGVYVASSWDDNDPSTWKWNIDHIIPQSETPYVSMRDENFAKCWALENLRPMSAKQNLLDGVRRRRHLK